jgi:tRNA threonylcarbamoyl adenosine modification protein (Sua5/YciO/YrdC/YwlC family)
MNSREQIKKIVTVIQKGGIVIFPTETVYALACSVNSEDAIERIKKIKIRDNNKPLSLLCKDIEQVSHFANIASHKDLIKKYSPGAVTYIVNYISGIKYFKLISPMSNTVGIRIPDHSISQQILQDLDEPIIATSVNLSGQPAAISIKDIDKEILSKIDYIIEDDNSLSGIASTIIDLTGKKLSILRQGLVKFS